MTSAERYPSDFRTPPRERITANNARNLLTQNPELLEPLNDFYHLYCSPDASAIKQFEAILSLGEVGNTVIIARQDGALHPDDPESYLIKQFDIQTAKEYTWEVVESTHSGAGDHLERTLLLENDNYAATLHLTNHNGGNSWHSDSEVGYLRSAFLLPYEAAYDISKKARGAIGKTATALTIAPTP